AALERDRLLDDRFSRHVVEQSDDQPRQQACRDDRQQDGACPWHSRSSSPDVPPRLPAPGCREAAEQSKPLCPSEQRGWGENATRPACALWLEGLRLWVEAGVRARGLRPLSGAAPRCPPPT